MSRRPAGRRGAARFNDIVASDRFAHLTVQSWHLAVRRDTLGPLRSAAHAYFSTERL